MKAKDILDSNHLVEPAGDNSKGAYPSFYWRDLYRSFVYPEEMVEEPIDMWYDNVLYGRLDGAGYPSYPSERFLKQITATETVFLVNFVADAYEDFKKFMDLAIRRGDMIMEDSFYAVTNPVKGWFSLSGLYHDWNQEQYNIFAGSFMTTERDEKMLDFEGFLKNYTEFVKTLAHKFPVTREHWLVSNWCPPAASGLVLDLVDAPPHQDDLKAAFLSDVNFYFFSTAANRFGFRVNKNAPWQIVADLKSKPMKKYMRRYGKTPEEMFTSQYFKTYTNDINVFKHYVWGWYNEYVTANPMAQLNRAASCSRATTSGLVEREQLTEEQAFAKISDNYWMRLYAYVRGMEERKDWNQAKFDKVVKKMLTYNRIKNRNEAMKFLHKELRKGENKNNFSLGNDLTKKQVGVILRQNNLKRHFGNFRF